MFKYLFFAFAQRSTGGEVMGWILKGGREVGANGETRQGGDEGGRSELEE